MKELIIWFVTIIITNLSTGLMAYMIGKRDALEGMANALADCFNHKEDTDGTEKEEA